MSYFLKRNLSATLGDYELSGIVDGMIATGFREPDAQVLVAMLVARELNQNAHPIYGLFVVGLVWNFIVLKGNEYCISQN